jgi:hypothetical protein
MLERLVNEDRAGAEELFHEIVVEKSREIYQNIIESEDQEEEADDEEEVEESAEEDDESLDESEEDDLDEMFGLDEFELEAGADPMMGGDATDDMMGNVDVDMPAMDGEEEGQGDVDERVTDLEDALDQLRAEFEALMSDEGGEEEHDDMDMGDEEGEEADDEEEVDDEEETEESFAPQFENKNKKNATEQMREYVEKVTPKMGDNGANTKSTVAGKNDMGGTTANIAKGGTANEKGTAGGLANNKPQVMNTKNVNVVGAKGATKMSSQPGHGAEKKGKPETAANTKSIIGK